MLNTKSPALLVLDRTRKRPSDSPWEESRELARSRGMGPWNHGSLLWEGTVGDAGNGEEAVNGEEAGKGGVEGVEEVQPRRESVRGGGLMGVALSLCTETESELSYWRMLASQSWRCSEKGVR